MKKVRKAVIPVAGLGTRFLPATKAMPKEMLTVVDRPVVQYAVDEALEAGIEHIVFVTGRNKHVIEDYFDIQPELLDTLARSGKKAQLASLERMQPQAGTISFTRQQAPHGLGHAVWCARDIIGDEPFALLLPDMVSFGDKGCLAGVMDLYARPAATSSPSSNATRGRPADTASSARVLPWGPGLRHHRDGREAGARKSAVQFLHQRPLHPAAGNLRHPEHAAARRRQRNPADRRHAAAVGEAGFLRQPFDGRMFDCGSKEGFIQANVAFALARDDIRDMVFEPIAEMIVSQARRAEAA